MLVKWLSLLLIPSLSVALPPKGGKEKQEQFLVTSLPGLYQNVPKDDIPLMFAGQLEIIPEDDTHYFFWKYVDQRKIPENKGRTTFWFNGGPGCSSMDGALLEAGPFRINKKGEVEYNAGSWHKASDIVFVDQPTGTGFSYGNNYVSELDQVGTNFLAFLEKFYEVFPEDRNNQIYLAGESYAGQYIPYVAKAILDHNKNLKDGETPYDLKTLIIGNGWVSPNEQGLSYLPFLHQTGLLTTSNPKWNDLLRQHEECQKVVDKIDSTFYDKEVHEYEINTNACEGILQSALDATLDTSGSSEEACVNVYDYTLKDSYPSCGMNWPFELQYVTPFLRQETVMSNLNLINHKKWKECSGSVGSQLRAKHSLPSIHLLPEILQQTEVLFFNGNLDIICNYIGTEGFIKKLTWGGETGFKENAADWVYDDKVTGYIKSERNLTFVNVFNASHMVPYDIPEVSRALVDLATGNYDIKERDNEGEEKKKVYVTYPLGERFGKENPEKPTKPEEEKPEKPGEKPEQSETPETPETPAESTTPENPHDSDSKESDVPSSDIPSGSSNPIVRIIQLVVIGIIIWAIFVVYAACRSKPSSIIKTGPSSGKKKNVQWADQLRKFQEDDEDFKQQKNQGFISKTFNKWKGTDPNGKYAPPGQYSENIELSEGVNRDVEDFVIESDEESGHSQPSHPI